MNKLPNKSKKKIIMLLVKLVIFALVVWGISRNILDGFDEVTAEDIQLVDLRWQWLLTAALLYLAGLFPCCIFWRKVMSILDDKPPLLQTARAYYIGHLGKYVPGKALVIILRTGLIHPYGISVMHGTIAVFYETLFMMAMGALLSCGILFFWVDAETNLILLSAGLVIIAGIPLFPPVLKGIIRWIAKKKNKPEMLEPLDKLNTLLLIKSGFGILFGWLLIGGSLWAVIQSHPFFGQTSLSDLPAVIAACAFCLVAGFLSLIPGGFGVREWILTAILGPMLGAAPAFSVAVLLRLVWLFAELILSAILYPLTGKTSNASDH